MKNFFAQMARALYQIIVVGIICLPYRLMIILHVLFTALMMVSTPGVSARAYLQKQWAELILAYRVRAGWVKNGDEFSRVFHQWLFNTKEEEA